MREVQAHEVTKAKLAAVTASEAALACRVQALSAVAERVPKLESQVAKLQAKLNSKPYESDHLIESAALKGERRSAALRKERDLARQQVLEKEKECAAAKKKEEAALQLSREAMQKAKMLRSGQAAVEAERRATLAEEQVVSLMTANCELRGQMSAEKVKAAAEQDMLRNSADAATLHAQNAELQNCELRVAIANGSAEIQGLKRDLSQSFADMNSMRAACAAEKEEAVKAAEAASDAKTKQAVLEVKNNMVRDACIDPHNLCSHSRDIISAGLKAYANGQVFSMRSVGFDKNGNLHHRGQYSMYMRMVGGKTIPEKLGPKQMNRRTNGFDLALNHFAQGKEHASAFLAAHA
eukprot:6197915-Pleurochrysis_carterae.AAC.1